MNRSRPPLPFWSKSEKEALYSRPAHLSPEGDMSPIDHGLAEIGTTDVLQPNPEESRPHALFGPLTGLRSLGAQFRCVRTLLGAGSLLRQATVYLPPTSWLLTLAVLPIFWLNKPKRLIVTFSRPQVLKFTRNPLRRFLAGQLLRVATRANTLTADVPVKLLELFPGSSKKILMAPGTLESVFTVVYPRNTASQNKTIVLTVGRLDPIYGQMVTLKALQTIPSDLRPSVEYWIVGRGSKVSYLERLRGCALEDPSLTVRFFGNIPEDELADVYDGADIFALTPIYESRISEELELAHRKAVAHGLPLVAHDVGQIPDVVRHGAAGFLVSPHRPSELAIVLEDLIRCRALRSRLGEVGLQWFKKNQLRSNTAKVLDSACPDCVSEPSKN